MNREQKLELYKANPSASFSRNKKKRNTAPTNELTKRVIDYIRQHSKCEAFRINTTGTYRTDIDKFVFSGATNGFPDIVACILGRFVGLEVKVGKDYQSEDQKAVQARIEATGGRYLIVKDFDTFKAWFDAKFEKAIDKTTK